MKARLAQWTLLLAIFWTAALSLRAEVVQSAPEGFVVQTTLEVSKDPNYVYNAFLKGVNKWWDSSHTFFGDAGNLSIDARAGGCFCEKAKTGKEVRHLQVVFVDPGKSIRLVGGLGPLQEHAVNGSLTVSFEEAEHGTLLKLTYRVGGYVPDGLDAWSQAVDSVLEAQMRRLKDYAEEKPKVEG